MNKEYIKRQLVFHDLGISINKDVQILYDIFKKTLEDQTLEEVQEKSVKSRFWKLNNRIVMDYDMTTKQIYVDYIIWDKFNNKYTNNEKGIIIGSFLEHTLKIETRQTLCPTLSPNDFYERSQIS